MSLEGLSTILDKAPIVGTQTAERMIESPQAVLDAYHRHVRTYVSLGRLSDDETPAPDQSLSVDDYERKLIALIRESQAPKGYIAGEFGYGKTSTALFMWDRCRQANILAVPPFRLAILDDLLLAVYGWARYEIGLRKPSLASQATDIYQKYVMGTLEATSRRLNIPIQNLDRLHQERRLKLNLTGSDYVQFFIEMTDLAHAAGFDGMVIFPDEVQQYIEPEIKAGVGDPIAPLFDLVNTMLTRRGQLACGLILVIPNKELGVINDQRRDLIDRLNSDGLGLRLEAIYDQHFPQRLWTRLAQAFDFTDHADHVVAPETLSALGQIAMREDLASGPRTVVDVFKVMSARYLQERSLPYSPFDLIDDMMTRRISYGTDKLQQTLHDALASAYVADRPEVQRAMRLIAAFPQDGCPRHMQERYGVAEAVDDLANVAQGSLVIFVGGGFDAHGNPVPVGATLRGLEKVQVDRDWIHHTVREFARTFYETNDKMLIRARAAFVRLLTDRLFPASSWRVMRQVEASAAQNVGLLLQGSFTEVSRRFPNRLVYVQVIGPGDEAEFAPPVDCDMRFQFILRRYLDIAAAERRYLPGQIVVVDARTARLELNVLHRDQDGIYRDLHQALQPVINPYKMGPLLMLSLHEYIEEKRRAHLIPKTDDPIVTNLLQPSLLAHSLEEMFNAEIGRPFDAAQIRLIVELLTRLCEGLYTQYHTLMTHSQWKSALGDYIAALRALNNPFQRQGLQNVVGSKDEWSKLFSRSHTGLDTLFRSYPELIQEVERPTRGSPGQLCFTLHPLEQRIHAWLQQGPVRQLAEGAPGSEPARMLTYEQVLAQSLPLGYREEEVDAILQLMQERGMVAWEQSKGRIVETLFQVPPLDEIEGQAQAWAADVKMLLAVYPDSGQLKTWQCEIEQYMREIDQVRAAPEEIWLINSRQNLAARRRDLTQFVQDAQERLLVDLKHQAAACLAADERMHESFSIQVPGLVDYARQINDLRQDLLARYNTLIADGERLRGEIDMIISSIQAMLPQVPPIADLAAAVSDLRKREQAIRRLQERRAGLEGQRKQYARCVTLVQRGSELVNDLGVLGTAVEAERADFAVLAARIHHTIGQSGLDALDEVDVWEQELSGLIMRAQQVKHAAIDRFNAIQDAYRKVLRGLQFSEQQMFARRTFNFADPEGSYDHLALDVQRNIQDLINQLGGDRNLGRLRADLLQIAQTTALPPHQAADIRGEAEGYLKQIQNQDAFLQALRRQAAQVPRIRDMDEMGHGMFAELTESLEQQVQSIVALRYNVQSLKQKLGRLELTAAEKELYAALQELIAKRQVSADEGGYVELADVYKHLSRPTDAKSPPTRSLLELLGDLYDKRRVRIKVGPLREE